jgi:hypothetical protein
VALDLRQKAAVDELRHRAARELLLVRQLVVEPEEIEA